MGNEKVIGSGGRLRTAVTALLCCALWGSAFPAIPVGYRLFGIAAQDTPSILLFAGVRFTVAGVLVLVAGSVRARRLLLPQRRELPQIGALALVQTVLQYVCFYMGLARTPSATAAILGGSSVFFAVLMAAVFRTERLTVRKLVGCAVGFSGIVILHATAFRTGGSVHGTVLMLLSSAAYGGAAVLMKRFSKTADPVLLCGWQFFAGGIFLSLVGLAGGGALQGGSGSAVLILLWLAFVSAAAYTGYSLLLQHTAVSGVSVYSFSTPVFGVLFSVLLPSFGTLPPIGILLPALLAVAVGIAITNWQPRR